MLTISVAGRRCSPRHRSPYEYAYRLSNKQGAARRSANLYKASTRPEVPPPQAGGKCYARRSTRQESISGIIPHSISPAQRVQYAARTCHDHGGRRATVSGRTSLTPDTHGTDDASDSGRAKTWVKLRRHRYAQQLPRNTVVAPVFAFIVAPRA